MDKIRRSVRELIGRYHSADPQTLCDKMGILDKLGRQNVCAHIDEAMARAKEIIGAAK